MSIVPIANDSIFVQATNIDGCKFKGTATIDVFTALPIFLGADTAVCNGRDIILAVNGNFDQYLWSNGSTRRQIGVNASGEYFVEAISAGGCVSRDTINVMVLDTVLIDLPATYTFCNGIPAFISPASNYAEYLWSTGDTTKSIIVPASGEYTLVVTGDNGCTSSSTTFVSIENCYKGIAYPNAFTPNNDGVNDTYKPAIGAEFKSYELTIYNRWGELLFRTTDTREGWDGRANGKPQDAGTYAWKCVYQENGKVSHMDTGWLILVR